MRLSVIIPVYNEEQTIDDVIDRVAAVDLGAIGKEIVIANDGSTDRTRSIIDARRWPEGMPVHVYHSPINLGKGAAVRLGLAQGRLVLDRRGGGVDGVVEGVDGDLALRPEDGGRGDVERGKGELGGAVYRGAVGERGRARR